MAPRSLSLQNVSFKIDGQLILQDLSFDLSEGEILTVVGPSGCGKSTLLNIVGGNIKDYEGGVFFRNRQIDTWIRGYIPQHLGLLPWKKVKANIFLANKINKNIRIAEEEAFEIINELSIGDLLDRYPSELSGGQQQRVALARLFVSCPDILLMDEPFSALDAFTADTSRRLFLKLWEKRKITTIFTTHNLLEAVMLGKQIMIMSKIPGKAFRIIENPLLEKGLERNEENCYQMSLYLRNLMGEEFC
ncbi:MAG: ATP-binding cassette domain-containing protein [Bacteroidales bacterium]|nr:ATP-binding cassette domain-containing protein [Bacteroidales bacterium]